MVLSLSLSSSALRTFSLHNNNSTTTANKDFLFAEAPRQQPRLFFHVSQSSDPLTHRLEKSFLVNPKGMVTMKEKKRRGFGAVCYAAPLTARNLQWISTVSSVVLMFSRGTAVQKSFLVPLFALQAPSSVISWIKSEYGVWTAFLALLFRLFFFIPGELELPFLTLVLVLVAPYQVMNLRGTQQGAIISLVIAGYLAFQHFSRAGSLRNAFDQGSIVATLAIIFITAVSCLLLI